MATGPRRSGAWHVVLLCIEPGAAVCDLTPGYLAVAPTATVYTMVDTLWDRPMAAVSNENVNLG